MANTLVKMTVSVYSHNAFSIFTRS